MQLARRSAAATALVLLVATSCSGGHGSTSIGVDRASRVAASTAPHTTPTAPHTTPTAPHTTPTAPPTAPTTSPPMPPAPPAPAVVSGPGVAVGDSVLEDVALYAPATLQAHGISINAAVGRQWNAGLAILSSLRAQGHLPGVVVVALGSNGRITSAMFDQLMQVCAAARRVVFMTVTGPLIGNNAIIRAGAARYPNAAVADWNALAKLNPSWFAPDHVHVGPAGAAALGNLLASVA